MASSDVQLLRLGGGQVLLRGAAVQVVAQLAALGARHWYSVDGARVSAPVQRLLDALEAEAKEHVREPVRPDVRNTPPATSSGMSTATQWQSSAQVATSLRCTERHVRRIATSLGGRRVGARWEFDPAEVTAYQLSTSTHHETIGENE